MANIKIQHSYRLIRIEGIDAQKTLFFDVAAGGMDVPLPGQFFMLEYNGMQKPFSFSHYDGQILGITIQSRGDCTKAMLDGKVGEWYGITGPLGRGFADDGEKFLLIGGGVGTAPLYYYLTYLAQHGKNVTALFGARNGELLEWTKPQSDKIQYYTDDGSFGTHGFVTQDLCSILKEGHFDRCAVCGPEKMMAIAANEIVKSGVRIKTEISMERYMKCGLGLCGSCVLDDKGDRVCTEGPVFDMEYLLNTPEFGHYHRNPYGQKEKL